MGERRSLYATISGLDPAGAKFAAEFLHDTMMALDLSDRAVQLDLQFFDNIDPDVLRRLATDDDPQVRKANKIKVLQELKDVSLSEQSACAEAHIAAPATMKAKRQEGTFFEEFVRLYRRFDNKEHVQVHDVALINDFLLVELGARHDA